MFAAEPTVAKGDCAKWMLDDPRVNFAISARGAPAGLNHLSVQVENADEPAEMDARLQKLEGEVVEEMSTACCYARSDKYRATDLSGIAWKTYHTPDSIPVFGGQEVSGCCAPAQPAAGGCC